ncbi:MAG: hypothetical protein ACREOG_03560, partial [Gemmatimonadaceae bacterium]
MEDEGRSAEARATLDRMKAIDPDVEPRPSGSYQTVKSNELVFLDIDDLPGVTPTRSTPVPAARAPQPDVKASSPPRHTPVPEPAVESPPTTLDGLTLTFVPEDAAAEAADAAALSGAQDLVDGFTPTGEQARITPGAVAPVDDFETGRQDPASIDLEFPSLIEIPPVAELDAAELAATRLNVESFADETMSGSEFAALELEPLDAPVEERPHDLALPSELPLIRFTEDVPVVDDPEAQTSATPDGIDIDAEIMSPISRSVAPAAINDQAFDITDGTKTESLDDAAAALDAVEEPGKAPNEIIEPIAEYELAPSQLDDPMMLVSEAAPPTDEVPELPQADPVHSLEWEDLAAAAAQHDVE